MLGKILQNKIFRLNPECYLVNGVSNSCIYDLIGGDLVSVRNYGKQILRKSESNCSIAEIADSILDMSKAEVLKYFSRLRDMGFGQFYNKPIYIEKIRVGQPEEVKDAMPAPPFLSHLSIELTTACNLDCVFCDKESNIPIYKCNVCKRWPNSRNKLKLADWKEVLSQARKLGCSSIGFFGGEPFIVWGVLRELISFSKDIGYVKVQVHTNGTLLTDDTIDKLKKNSVTLILNAYSHHQGDYDNITQKYGSFSLFKSNLEKLNHQGIEYFIFLLLMKYNEKYIKKTREYWCQFSPRQVYIDFIYPHREGKNHYSRKFLKEIYDQKKQLPRITKESFFHSKKYHPCWGKRLAITSGGDILPCIFARKKKLGNVREIALWKLLKNRSHEKYWYLTKDRIDRCKDCEYRYACFDCRVMESEATRQLRGMEYCNYNPYYCTEMDSVNSLTF